jgi:Putative Flp pilus-assembly TadE/G-like
MREQSRLHGQGGAIIIHVAFALAALLAFAAIVMDYGAMWVSRRQAQSAADAGALAGAVALMKDGGTVSSFTLNCPAGSTTPACLSARQWANSNEIFGQNNSDANVDVKLSGTGSSVLPCDQTPGCVRVDVMRNMPRRTENGGQILGNPIPTFFGPFIGINGQGVRATATAWVWNGGNQVECLVPFATIDRWADNYDDNPDNTYFPTDSVTSPGVDGWSPNDSFQPASGDVYIAPYDPPGDPNYTGWKVATPTALNDFGRQLILKSGSTTTPGYSSGWAMQVDLPASTGSSDYNWNIKNCNKQKVGIAKWDEQCLAVNEPIGCISVKTGIAAGPTAQGIKKDTDSVVEQDPTAYWNTTLNTISGGKGMSSPRIRPLVILDINHYITQNGSKDCSGTGCVGKIANIIGFFIEGMCKDVADDGRLASGMVCPDPTKDVVGRIVNLPADYVSGVGTVEDTASFLKILQLVR